MSNLGSKVILCYTLRLGCSLTIKDKDGQHKRRPHLMEVLCK